MVVTLYHPQRVLLHVFSRHKPGVMLATTALSTFGLESTNAKPLALTERVKRQPHMFANGVAFRVLDRARFLGNVAVQKFTKWTLANKADAGGIFLLGVGQLHFSGDAAHFCLEQLANGE